STTLRAITGLIRPRQGSVKLKGRDINRLPTHQIVQSGVAMVPEGRKSRITPATTSVMVLAFLGAMSLTPSPIWVRRRCLVA
ncbi:ATP-binding cassette domain-containing protein, partial [Acetomicrobium sp. S15 = DSM 107314]|uniref:ATP-binding cassette domain-containing protein n=1 Tax=Acetomicrobium sp. S15 = DSM 107314 TaxID=2529858 RepID=UPI00406C969D